MITLKNILLSLLIIFSISGHALADDAFTIENFTTTIDIEETGELMVNESIQVNFSEDRRGIFRDIKTNGIEIEVQQVTNEKNEDWQFSEEYLYKGKRIRIGNPNIYLNGDQTYNINYNVKKVIQFFETHDELYWNVTGNEWPTKIKSATAIVNLPSSVRGSDEIQFKCFTGHELSSEENCHINYDQKNNSITFITDDILSSYSGLTIVVGVPKGILPHPVILEIKSEPEGAEVFLNNGQYPVCTTNCRNDDFTPGEYEIKTTKFGYKSESKKVQVLKDEFNVVNTTLKITIWFVFLKIIFVILLILIVIEPFYTFIKRGRDPNGKSLIIPYYNAPDNMTPAEVGTLLDEKVHLKDISSTIVDLAVKGYLKIKVLPDKSSWIFKKDDYKLIKVNKPKKDDGKLTKFERALISYIFGNSSEKKISSLKNKFYSKLPKLKKKLYTKLIKEKYFSSSPDKIRSKYLSKALITIFPITIGAIITELSIFGTSFSLVFLVNGIFTLVFSPFMPKKTKKGVLTFEKIIGFKLYLETAEKDRLEFQEKKNLFYKFLPYAMTLGIADKWGDTFEEIFDKPPDWYKGIGDGKFHPSGFVSSINTMSHSLHTAFTSHPAPKSSSSGSSWHSSSSYSSGFSSGGFSGGGFGGGGGGSW